MYVNKQNQLSNQITTEDGWKRGQVDFKCATKTSGVDFFFLMDKAPLLDFAQKYAIDKLQKIISSPDI